VKDLKSQLASAFGRDPQAEAPPAREAVLPAALPALLGPDAHLASPWLQALRRLAGRDGVPAVPARPGLPAARQLTDTAVKALKGAGRKRDASELSDLRARFLSARDKEAWGLVKARFVALDLSEKAYRALKQGEADPLAVWTRLSRCTDAELQAMGHARLREVLGS